MNKSTVIHTKKLRILYLCLCVIMLLTQLAPTADAASSSPTLLILGDSIATGYGLSDYNKNAVPKSSQSWPSLLAGKLSYNQQNLAVDGATTADLFKAVSTSSYSLAVKTADIICISIGGNDFLQMMNEYFDDGKNINLMSVIKFISEVDEKAGDVISYALTNVENVFKIINSTGTKAKILVQTLYNPYEFWDFSIPFLGSVDDYFQPYIEEYNEGLKELVREYGFILSDVFTEFNTTKKSTSLQAYCDNIEDLSSGDFSMDPHPTAEGHHRIYELNYAALSGSGALYTYLGYVTPESVFAEYGTDKAHFNLPDKVTVNTNRGQLTVTVSGWDTSGYDTQTYKAQQFIATAKINLPDYVNNTGGISETAAVTVNVKAAPDLKEIISPDSIRGIKSGTAISEIDLPETVSIVVGDSGKIYPADVDWDTAAYDPSRAGPYEITLSGKVTLPQGVANGKNIPLVTAITLSVTEKVNESDAITEEETGLADHTDDVMTSGEATEGATETQDTKPSEGRIINRKVLLISTAVLLGSALLITAAVIIFKRYKK